MSAAAATTIEVDRETGQKVYRPDGETLKAFLRDRSFVSIIRGPIGSGTSSACCFKVYQLAMEQPKGLDGWRRSRFAVIRNTFPDLKNTTIKTWLNWFPEEQYGRFVWERPFRQELRIGDVICDVHFLALDDETDIRKLRSLELTGAWFNELEFCEKPLFDEALSRCGRYPPIAEGGPGWYGVFADMNAPNEDHWVPMLFGDVPLPDEWTDEERKEFDRPPGWRCFVQPAGLVEETADDGKTVAGYRINPLAENLRWLPRGYYLQVIQSKVKSWIDSHVMNRITLHVEGRPVWPSFRAEVHVARVPLKAVPGHPIIVGLDFGRTPAAVWAQCIRNRWRVLGELGAVDASAVTFAPLLRGELARRFPEFDLARDFQFWGDPKGQDKSQSDERTAYDIFRANGMLVRPAPVLNNSIATRIAAVDSALNRMVDGEPGWLLSPVCRTLKVAMAGAYHYRRIRGTARHSEVPEKDKYSHFADAGQYMVLGGGEGRTMVGRGGEGATVPLVRRDGARRFAGARRPF